jgi:hypothetical protein
MKSIPRLSIILVSVLLPMIALAADPVGEIRGIVKDEQGLPLAGVKVQMCGFEKLDGGTWRRELRSGLMPFYTTDEEGRFTIPVHDPELRYDFYCDRAGYAPTFLYAVTNHSPELTVLLQRGLTVTGTVRRLVNGKAEPVPSSQVELRLPYVDWWYQQRTTTDQHGQYKFHVTPPTGGRKWQVVFAGEVVPLEVEEGRPVKGPDFEVTVKVGSNENESAGQSAEDFQPKAGFVPGVETNAPSLVIYTSGGYPPPGATNFGPQIIVVLWSDGKIVWSGNEITGGPPLRQGSFPKEKLAALMDTVERKGAFTNQALRRAWLGPDSRFTTIAADDGRRKLRLLSWHELFEQRTNLVATAHGIEGLGGRNRDTVLQDQPEDYRQFRKIWSEIRQAVVALVPMTGEPYEGPLPIPTR